MSGRRGLCLENVSHREGHEDHEERTEYWTQFSAPNFFVTFVSFVVNLLLI